MDYFVYVLKSLKTENYYKGITNDINRRITEHFEGSSFTTKSQLPLKLVHVEACRTREEARNLEKFFKSGFGREIIRQMDEELEA